MPEIRGLDVSAFSGQRSVELDAWRQAYAQGWRFIIAQAWGGRPNGMGPNPLCERQLWAARNAGLMPLGAYIWLPPDSTTQTQILIQVAKDAIGDEYPRILSMAFDLEGGRLHPTNPERRLSDAISHVVEEKPIGIYSSRSQWPVVMGGSEGYAGTFQWDARWGSTAGLDDGYVAYGGWKRCAIRQYAGTTNIAGFLADLNTADPDRILGVRLQRERDEYGLRILNAHGQIGELKDKAQKIEHVLEGR